jgi:hypothetical protein
MINFMFSWVPHKIWKHSTPDKSGKRVVGLRSSYRPGEWKDNHYYSSHDKEKKVLEYE